MGLQKKAYYIILNILCIIAAIIAVTYAWFAFNSSTPYMIFQAGYVDSVITLFKGTDFDYDGILDVDVNNEKVYQNIGDTTNENSMLELTAEQFFPTQVRSWKVEVKNKGNIVGIASVNFSFPKENYEQLKLLSVVVGNEKKYFANYPEGNMEILGNMIIQDEHVGYFEFKIQMETLESLNNSGVLMTIEEYNRHQGSVINLPKLVINLQSK